MIAFECVEGLCVGQLFEFPKASVTLGRSPECNVWLNDSTCSRQHARVDVRAGGFIISDLGSTNGILVNGEKVDQSVIRFGDRFCVGKNVFVFRSSQVAAESKSLNETGIDEFINNTVTFGAAEARLLDAAAPKPVSAPSGEEGAGGAAELEALRKANAGMRAVYGLSRAINSTLELTDLYELIIENVVSHFANAERVCVFRVDRESGEFTRVKAESKTEYETLPVSREVLETVRASHAGILASDVLTDERFGDSQTLFDTRVRALMCVPLLARENVLGAVYVESWTKTSCFEETDLELLTVFGNHIAIALENALLYQEIQTSFYETVRSLSKALEAKDKYTRGHSGRVAFYSVGIGRYLGLGDKQLENLKVAAELHDIGKIALPEQIINAGRALTDEEYEAVKKHPDHGVEILKPIRFLGDVLPIVRHHHERFNGKGYPSSLSGEQIPLEARILNLADAFDAMTTKRPYNKPKTFAQALEQCRSEAGVSFDANCVKALCLYIEARFEKTPQRMHTVTGERASMSAPFEGPDEPLESHKTSGHEAVQDELGSSTAVSEVVS